MCYLMVIISQLLFSFMRVLNIKYITNGNIKMTLLTSFMIKKTALIGIYFSITSLINLDYKITIVYLISGITGEYIALKLNKY